MEGLFSKCWGKKYSFCEKFVNLSIFFFITTHILYSVGYIVNLDWNITFPVNFLTWVNALQKVNGRLAVPSTGRFPNLQHQVLFIVVDAQSVYESGEKKKERCTFVA